MNPNNAKQYIPAIEALADGELQRLHIATWLDTETADFSMRPDCYRRKPKPTVIPWTLETCPVGAVVKNKSKGHRCMLNFADVSSAAVTHYGAVSYQLLLADFTMDNGQPCGVVQS